MAKAIWVITADPDSTSERETDYIFKLVNNFIPAFTNKEDVEKAMLPNSHGRGFKITVEYDGEFFGPTEVE